MAGALEVQLGGINHYEGVPATRAYLGDPVQPLTKAHIERAVRLMLWASGLGVFLSLGWLLTVMR